MGSPAFGRGAMACRIEFGFVVVSLLRAALGATNGGEVIPVYAAPTETSTASGSLTDGQSVTLSGRRSGHPASRVLAPRPEASTFQH